MTPPASHGSPISSVLRFSFNKSDDIEEAGKKNVLLVTSLNKFFFNFVFLLEKVEGGGGLGNLSQRTTWIKFKLII